MRRKISKYIAGGILFALVTSIALPAYIYVTSARTYAAAGDGVAATYGISLNGDGSKPDFKASDIKSAAWEDANTITVTFKNDLTAKFHPMNDADNGRGELADQRMGSMGGGGDVAYSSSDTGCYAQIHADLDESKDPIPFIMTVIATMKIDLDFRVSADGECVNSSSDNPTVTMTNSNLSVAYFRWIDSGTIASADGEHTFTKVEGTQAFVKDSEAGSSCKDKLILDSNGNVRYYELDTKYGGDPPADVNAGDCKYRETIDDGSDLEDQGFPPSNTSIPLGGQENKALAAGTGDKSSLVSVGGTEPPSCESSGFSLSWLFCGIVNGLAEATDKIHDNMLLPLLKNPRIDTADSASSTYKAWTSFRNIANVLLLFGLLFVVFGQSLGMDAYTAKKTMPKVLVAAILINLSYYLIAIANDLTAVIGGGIASLIKAPFLLNGDFSFSFSGGTSGLAGGLGLSALFGIGAVSAIAGGGLSIWAIGGGILSFLFAFVLLPVFLAILGAAVVLILRRGILLLLTLISPVAFALLAIPGGEKYFKKYRELLFSTLLVYPLFEAIWAIAQVLAVTINKANGNDSSQITSLIGLVGTMIALFAPLFLIPFAFKLAGGILATVGAIANDKGKGLIDGRKKRWAEKPGAALHNAENSKVFRNAVDGSRRARLNSGVSTGLALKHQGIANTFSDAGGLRGIRENGVRGTVGRMRSGARNAHSMHADSGIDQLMKDHPELAKYLADDAVNSASRFNTMTEIIAELQRFDPGRYTGPENAQRLQDTAMMIMKLRGDHGSDVFSRARLRVMAKTGTGYQNAQGEFDASLAMDDINRVYGEDRIGAGAAIAEIRGSLLQSGQIAGAAGFSNWAATTDRLYRGEITEQEAHEIIMNNAIDSAQPGQYAYMKPSAARAAGETYARRIQGIAAEVTAQQNVVQSVKADIIAGRATSADLNVAQAQLDSLNGDLATTTAAATTLLESISMQAPPQIASAFANTMMSQQVNVTLTTSGTEQRPVIGSDGKPEIDPVTKRPVMQVVPTTGEVTAGTIRNLIEVLPRTNQREEYENRRRDSMRNLEDMQRQGQNGPPAPPTMPTMPSI